MRQVLHPTGSLPSVLNPKNQIPLVSSLPAGFSVLIEITPIVPGRYETPPLVLLLRFSKMCCCDYRNPTMLARYLEPLTANKAFLIVSWWPYCMVPASFLLENWSCKNTTRITVINTTWKIKPETNLHFVKTNPTFPNCHNASMWYTPLKFTTVWTFPKTGYICMYKTAYMQYLWKKMFSSLCTRNNWAGIKNLVWL